MLYVVNSDIDKLVIHKNDAWYALSGFIYSLVKLGFTEDYLLGCAPVELALISSKVRQIEDEIAKDLEQQRNRMGG